ncbi:nuclear transport factor 2 family protein [Natronomonas sp. EA1]|uniref:nuclear transport factor 2 family protein n=1 Tax=Natronomonas sp. EA1 TaxID=3421655 RepID=UPI003EBD88A4
MSSTDRHAIQRLKYDYCDAIDEGRYEEWVSLFTDDGVFRRADAGDSYTGTDALYTFATERFDTAFAFAAHVLTNPRIDVSGEEATGTWYLQLVYRTADGEEGLRQGRYADRYRKVDGEWYIAETEVGYGMRISL